jgi:hypothetical protein
MQRTEQKKKGDCFMKYGIKSTSEEGVYFLVNGWEKHRAFWLSESEVLKSPTQAKKCHFNTPSQAKTSLTKLLKVMDDYTNDVFEEVVFE